MKRITTLFLALLLWLLAACGPSDCNCGATIVPTIYATATGKQKRPS